MEYVYIGKLQGTHGLKGGIKLKTNFEYLENILKEGFSFFIGEEKSLEVLKSARTNKDIYLLSFENIDDIEKIKKYVNKKLFIKKEDLILKENEYVIEDLINKEAYFNNKLLGVINDIESYGNGNNVMKIVNDKELLIPCNKHFIDKVTDKVYLKNMEVFINED